MAIGLTGLNEDLHSSWATCRPWADSCRCLNQREVMESANARYWTCGRRTPRIRDEPRATFALDPAFALNCCYQTLASRLNIVSKDLTPPHRGYMFSLRQFSKHSRTNVRLCCSLRTCQKSFDAFPDLDTRIRRTISLHALLSVYVLPARSTP